MASTIWRMSGLATFGGGDLELSQLRLWGAASALDAGATLTCSHAPIAGVLENLRDDNSATVCRWRAEDVRAPGFFFEWKFQEAVDAWCVRLASPEKSTSVARYDLGLPEGGTWKVDRNGDLVYGAGLSAARSLRPLFGVLVGWTQSAGPVADTSGFFGTAVSADGQVIVVTAAGSTAGRVSISRDAGITWAQPTGPVAGIHGFVGAAISADGKTVVVTGIGSAASQVNISRDSGLTWEQAVGPVAGTSGIYSAAISADGRTIVVGARGTSASKISISRDAGVTWTQPIGPAAGSLGFMGVAVSADGQTIAVAAQGTSAAKVSISRDAGTTWLQPLGPVADTVGFGGIDVSADGLVIVATAQGTSDAKVSISRDAGVTWTQPAGLVAGVSGYLGVAVSADGQTVIAPGYATPNAMVNISLDAGLTWGQSAGAVAGSGGYYDVAISAASQMVVLAGTGSASAKVNIRRGVDPSYVAQPLDFKKPDFPVSASKVPPPPQGIQGAYATRPKKALDVECGGQGRIYGAVARKGAPSNTPMRRRVRLHRSVDGYLARETWSKVDGSYEFREISTRYEWDVIAWDYELQEFSTVANNQLAEVMP